MEIWESNPNLLLDKQARYHLTVVLKYSHRLVNKRSYNIVKSSSLSYLLRKKIKGTYYLSHFSIYLNLLWYSNRYSNLLSDKDIAKLLCYLFRKIDTHYQHLCA
jgi:hypothetical protein